MYDNPDWGFQCFFLSCKVNARVIAAKTGHGPHSSLFLCCSIYFLCCSVYFCVVLCIVCFMTFPVLFVCICVLNNCHRVATELQLNIYHIICSSAVAMACLTVTHFLPHPWLIYMDLCSLFDGKALRNPLHHFASMLPALICPSALDEFMVRLTPRPLNPTYSLIWSVNGPQSRSGLSQKKEISRLCPESNPGLFSPKPTHYGQRCPGSFGVNVLQDWYVWTVF
jgi:hypothetical protein